MGSRSPIWMGNFRGCPAHWKALEVSSSGFIQHRKSIMVSDSGTVITMCSAPDWLLSHYIVSVKNLPPGRCHIILSLPWKIPSPFDEAFRKIHWPLVVNWPSFLNLPQIEATPPNWTLGNNWAGFYDLSCPPTNSVKAHNKTESSGFNQWPVLLFFINFRTPSGRGIGAFMLSFQRQHRVETYCLTWVDLACARWSDDMSCSLIFRCWQTWIMDWLRMEARCSCLIQAVMVFTSS